jgi:hypothetical protein
LMFISPAFFLDDSENKETHSVLGKVCWDILLTSYIKHV